MQKFQKGFSLIELLVVVVVIGIVAAISIPNLVAARRSANEGSAVSSLRTLHGAQMTYSVTHGNGNYAGAVGASGTTAALTELRAALIIDPVLGSATKSGYGFLGGRVASTPAIPATYFFAANPTNTSGPSQTGTRRFGISIEGVMKADVTPGNLGTPYTSATVATATPL